MVSKKAAPTRINSCTQDKVFMVVLHVVLAFILVVVVYPLLFVLFASVSDPQYVNSGALLLYPKGFNLLGYQQVFRDQRILIGYGNTIYYTVLGSALAVAVNMMAGYALSRDDLPGRGIVMALFVFTMYFGGGLIPTYMLYMEMKLIRTYWVMVLPYGLSITYFIIMRNYFSYSVPRELEDAARIDGCNDVRVFFQVILPLSKPMLAAVSLFIAVGFWNDYYSYMMYIATKPTLQPFAWVLRRVLTDSAMMSQMRTGAVDIGAQLPPPMALRMATIICAMLPIMCVYPFLQKHFAKGVLIGAVKE